MKTLLTIIAMLALIRAAFCFCSEEYLCGKELVRNAAKESL